MKLRRPLVGGEVGGDVLAVERGLRRWSAGSPSPDPDGVFEQRDQDRLAGFQHEAGIPTSGKLGQPTLDALWPYIDAYGRMRYRVFRVPKPEPEPSSIPDLGPVVAGGASMLEQDLTHMTGGLDGYAAFDDGWGAGVDVLAPEALTVTKHSSARRRDGNPNGKAFYATGESGLLYWFGHVENIQPVGAKLAKGAKIADISGNHEKPHLHVGVNSRPLTGRTLEHHTDYTHGSKTIGEQLRKALGS